MPGLRGKKHTAHCFGLFFLHFSNFKLFFWRNDIRITTGMRSENFPYSHEMANKSCHLSLWLSSLSHLPAWSAQELSPLVAPRPAPGLGHTPPWNAARPPCLPRRPHWAPPCASGAVRGARPPTQVHRVPL